MSLDKLIAAEQRIKSDKITTTQLFCAALELCGQIELAYDERYTNGATLHTRVTFETQDDRFTFHPTSFHSALRELCLRKLNKLGKTLNTVSGVN